MFRKNWENKKKKFQFWENLSKIKIIISEFVENVKKVWRKFHKHIREIYEKCDGNKGMKGI